MGIVVLGNMNSGYIEAIAQEIDASLHNEKYSRNIRDLNKTIDEISSFVILFGSILLGSMIYFIFISIHKSIKRKVFLLCMKKHEILGSILFVLLALILLYKTPNILYDGVSWEYVFIWLPPTVKYAVFILAISIVILMIFFLLELGDLGGDKREICILSCLSILSGIGNALVIFVVNIVAGLENEKRIQYFWYFFIGVILYIWGQKFVKNRLVQVSYGWANEKRKKIIKQILDLEYQQVEKFNGEEIQTVISSDIKHVGEFPDMLIGAVTNTATIISCFIYLGYLSKKALIFATMIILYIVMNYFVIGRYVNQQEEMTRNIQNIFYEKIDELIRGLKELCLSKVKKKEFRKDIYTNSDIYSQCKINSGNAFVILFIIGETFFLIAIGSIVFLMPFIVEDIKSQELISYILVLLYMIGPVHSIMNIIPRIIEVIVCKKHIDDLDKKLEKSSYFSENHIRWSKKIDGIFMNQIEYQYNDLSGEAFKVGPINFQFRLGEITFIVGGNGSGKSTLVKLICGLYKPTKGEIVLNEKITELNENCAVVFADTHLFKKLYGITKENIQQQANDFLKKMRMDKKVRLENGEFNSLLLSTGERKRLALLVACMEERPIYIFDEWAAEQAPEFKKWFYKSFIMELKEKGKCVICVSHDDMYFNCADRVVTLEQGRIRSIN